MQNGSATLEYSLVITKLNIVSTYNLAITFLGIYRNELKTTYTKSPAHKRSIAALFIIAKTWKQPVNPTVGEQIYKIWYIHTMEHYLEI